MYATDIKARIEKTEETIAKKNALIDKRFKAIGKCIEGMKKAVADLGGHIDFEFTEDIERIDEQNSVAEEYIKGTGTTHGTASSGTTTTRFVTTPSPSKMPAETSRTRRQH